MGPDWGLRVKVRITCVSVEHRPNLAQTRVQLINCQLIPPILSSQHTKEQILFTHHTYYSYIQHYSSFNLSFSINSQPSFPLPQEHRSDSQSNSHTQNSSLNTKDQSNPIALDPRRLELSHREPAAGAPHIQNGRDTGRLLWVFFQCVGRDSTVQMMLEI